MQRFLAERKTAITFAGYYKKPRTATMRALGGMMLPQCITDAWYAADCPPRLDTKAAGIPFRVRAQWRVGNLLRGADKG